MRSWLVMGSVLLLGTTGVQAQSGYPPEVPGAPPAIYADPLAAAARLEAMLQADSTDAGAAWRAALALVAAGRAIEGTDDRRRDSLYRAAQAHAERAVQLAPGSADAHFALAVALGRASLTRSGQAKVRDAGRILQAARAALALDPGHDGAWRALGRWHAEIMRLSAIERFVARRFLGGGVLGQASWDEAQRALERAVTLRGDWIEHRLDLALVYLDRGDTARAIPQLDAIARLPVRDATDPRSQREAAGLLQRLTGSPAAPGRRTG